jgi:hypothetical protein
MPVLVLIALIVLLLGFFVFTRWKKARIPFIASLAAAGGVVWYMFIYLQTQGACIEPDGRCSQNNRRFCSGEWRRTELDPKQESGAVMKTCIEAGYTRCWQGDCRRP